MRFAVRLRLDAVADNLQLGRRKISGKQRLADVLRNTDDQRRLALQCCTAPLEDRRHQPPAVVLVLGRVSAVERDHQWKLKGPGDRQGERAASAEMSMDQPWPQRCEIRRRRNVAELLEHEPVKSACHASPTEQYRFDTELGQAGIGPAADPDRLQTPEADILPTQEMGLRGRNDAISIDEQCAVATQKSPLPQCARIS